MKRFMQFIRDFRGKCFDQRLQQALHIPNRKIILFTPCIFHEALFQWVESYKRIGVRFDYVCVPEEIFERVQQQIDIHVIKLHELKKELMGGGDLIFKLRFFEFAVLEIL